MNKGLRNELALATGLAAGLCVLGGKKSWARNLGALALGIRFLPERKPFSFRNKSVVITGGSRGLGLALAHEFLNEGAQVSILARDATELSAAKDLLKKRTGLEVFTYICDITNEDQFSQSLSAVHGHFGEIDILVNNAGSILAAPFEATETTDYKRLMDLHFFAIQNSFKMLVPYFKQKGYGHFVNISSIGGKIPVPHLASYCASKFALSAFSQTAAAELQQHGIQVTTVFPGLMRTGSPVQAVFKGDAEKEYAWFALSDHAPGLSMPVQVAARKIVSGIRDGRTDLTLSLPAILGSKAYALFPEIFTKTIAWINIALPKNISKESHSGALSKHWIESKLTSFRKKSERLRSEYNQKEVFF